MDRLNSNPFVHGLLLAGVLAGGGCNQVTPPSLATPAAPPSNEPALLHAGPATPIRPPVVRESFAAELRAIQSEARAVAATGPVERAPSPPPEADPVRYGPAADPPGPGGEKASQAPALRRVPPIVEMASNGPIGQNYPHTATRPDDLVVTWPGVAETARIPSPDAAPPAPVIPAPTIAAPAMPAPAASEFVATPQPIAQPQVRRDLLPAPLAPHEVEALRSVDLQAQQKLVRAQELASRGAAWSARGELLDVLRMIAESCDSLRQNDEFRRALGNGLEALREVEDFSPKSGNGGREISVVTIAATHRTPALKNAPIDHLTPLAAQQEYLSYAQQQLSAAAAGTVSGSAALYGLGRLQDSLTTSPGTGARSAIAMPRAMALYQAALLADRTNHLAANELGVLLAKYGENGAARQVLILSLQIQPQLVTWNNLAFVHDRLGEHDLAQKARQAGQLLVAQNGGAANGVAERIRWVDKATFAATSDEGGWPEQAPPPPAAKKTAAPVAKAGEPDSKTASAKNDTGWSIPFWSARGTSGGTNQ